MRKILLPALLTIAFVSCSKKEESYPDIDLTGRRYTIEGKFWTPYGGGTERPGYLYVDFIDRTNVKNGRVIFGYTGDTVDISGPFRGTYSINLKDSIMTVVPIDDTFQGFLGNCTYILYAGDSIVTLPAAGNQKTKIFKRKW